MEREKEIEVEKAREREGGRVRERVEGKIYCWISHFLVVIRITHVLNILKIRHTDLDTKLTRGLLI